MIPDILKQDLQDSPHTYRQAMSVPCFLSAIQTRLQLILGKKVLRSSPRVNPLLPYIISVTKSPQREVQRRL